MTRRNRSEPSGDGPSEWDIREALDAAAGAVDGSEHSRDDRAGKKNFAEHLSRSLAQRVADALRDDFPGITPDAEGRGHERRTRTGKGTKKLDVNYSTPDLGLGLGVSIKTINAADPSSGRFTKNLTRIDNELRAEAKDYHERQPYSVMVALIFLPESACRDGHGDTPSSFGAAIRQFRHRANRTTPAGEAELFERVFVACYRDEGADRGRTWFFDVMEAPPKQGRPVAAFRLSFAQVLAEIRRTYDLRNDPPFAWATETE